MRPIVLLLVAVLLRMVSSQAPVYDPSAAPEKTVLYQPCELCTTNTFQSTYCPPGSTLIQTRNVRSSSINGYWLSLPAGYNANPNMAYPVLLFFHGRGERGNGANSATNYNFVTRHGPLLLVKTNRFNNYVDVDDVSKPLPFIVIAPQTNRGDWNTPIDRIPVPALDANGQPTGHAQVDANGKVILQSVYSDEANRDAELILQDALSRLRIDTSRVYVTGLSQGGYGTWYALTRYTNLVAAGVVVCGFYNNPGNGIAKPDVCNAKDIPIWAFHNDGDGTVKFNQGDSVINAINKCHSNAAGHKASMHIYVGGTYGGKTAEERMAIYDTQGRPYTYKGVNSHNSWTDTYGQFNRFSNVANGGRDLNIYAWLLQFSSDGF